MSLLLSENAKWDVDRSVTVVYTLVTMRTVVHIKIDSEVKENAQQVAKDLGLTLSDVIHAALRNLIRDRTVIFSDIPRMTPEFEKKLEKIEEDIKHGRNLSPKFKTAKEAIDYLDSL